jgi:hypothetical protein
MSNKLCTDVRPNSAWSEPVDRESTRRLHRRFAALQGFVERSQVEVAMRQTGKYRHPLYTPLSDGYQPFAIGILALGRHDRVAVVFPFCTDTGEDGTSTDRSVSVHTLGKVDADELDALVQCIESHLPVARAHSTPAFRGFGWMTYGSVPRSR